VPDKGEALPVVLRRGGTVRIVGIFEEDGRPADRIYAQIVSDEKGMTDPDTWVHEEAGALTNTRVPPGIQTLRVACFLPDGSARFSDRVNLQVAAGQPVELRLALKPGTRFAGKLDENVPRPVLDGHVDVNVLAGCDGAENLLDWRARTNIDPNGLFIFESLPSGLVELIAFCAGYASISPDARDGRRIRRPQTFESQPGDETAVVAMELTATVRVHVADKQGRPLPGARAHLNPNVIFGGRYSGIFGTGHATEELLRMGAEARRKELPGRGRGPKFHGLTDEYGAVTIPNIPAGKQRLFVFVEGYETEPSSRTERGHSRQEIELLPGEAREVRVTMRRSNDGQ